MASSPTRPPPSATLTVWCHDNAVGAAGGEVRLLSLESRGAITVVDAVTITWPRGVDRPRIAHLEHRGAAAVARGSMLGALAGTLILAPLAGAAAGAGIGALASRWRGTGIDRHFLEELQDRMRPGTSAMLVLATGVDLDAVRRVVERDVPPGEVTLLHARLRDGRATDLLDPTNWSDPGDAPPARDS